MASADPLLTTLCSVCRTNPPRYKCPRCSIRYCSVPCNHRHRARAGCSGIRDVTTFVPRSRLRTAAGIDRDYNFLQGIDVARSSAFKHVVDERRVLRANDVQVRVLGEEDPAPSSQQNSRSKKSDVRGREGGPALFKQWKGEELQFMPARPRVKVAAAGEAKDEEEATSTSPTSPSTTTIAAATATATTAAATTYVATYEAATSHRVRGLCRRDNVELLGAPRGFARQRENKTTVATTTTTTCKGSDGHKVSEVHLHWQVEWLVYHSNTTNSNDDDDDDDNGASILAAKPTRVLRRVLDNVPLYRAHVSLLAWERRQQGVTVLDDNDEEAKVVPMAATDGGDMDTRADADADADNDRRSGKTARRPPQKPHPQQSFNRSRTKHTKRGRQQRSPAPAAGPKYGFFYVCDVQDPATGAWHSRTPSDHQVEDGGDEAEDDQADDEEHLAAKHNVGYYLLRPRPPGSVQHTQAKELIPLSATDTLATALPGRVVLEFPTIYVLPRGGGGGTAPISPHLPPGHVLGSTTRRERAAPLLPPPVMPNDNTGKKLTGKRRQSNGKSDGDAAPSAKKRKTVQFAVGTRDADDEGDGDGVDTADAAAAAELDSETSSSGEDSSDEEEDDDESEEEDEEEGELAEDDDDEEEDPAIPGNIALLPALLHGLGSSGTMPADGKPKLVVYDSWSEGSDA